MRGPSLGYPEAQMDHVWIVVRSNTDQIFQSANCQISFAFLKNMRHLITLSIATLGLTTLAVAQADKMDKMDMARYGGPTYTGAPALNVTASLVAAGGGSKEFSTAKALTSMVGSETVTAEVQKLTKEFGKKRVTRWLKVFDFAVGDALRIATAAGVSLPEPDLKGTDLAGTLVKASMDADGTVYTEFLLDKAVTHKIHMLVMNDIDHKFGAQADEDYHLLTNTALYDLAMAFKVPGAKLAKIQ